MSDSSGSSSSSLNLTAAATLGTLVPTFPSSIINLSSDDPVELPLNSHPSQLNEKVTSSKDAIMEARDLLVLPASLEESYDEQSNITDLLEILGEFIKKGNLTKAVIIITSQIDNSETASQKFEK